MDFIKRHKTILLSTTLFLLIFFIYLAVINGKFFFDDDTFVRFNSSITSGDRFYEYFTSQILEGADLSSNFYRPLQTISYRALYLAWGLNSLPFHILQISLHAINTILIFLLLKKLGFKENHSFIASILFGIHPVLTQAVSYISGLADPIYLMFTLIAAHLLLRILHKKQHRLIFAILTVLSIILALLSRETAVISFAFLALIFIYDRNSRKDEGYFENKYAIAILGVTTIISILYVISRFSILKFTDNVGLNIDENVYTKNLSVRLITFVSILWDYFVLIVFPKDLNYEKPYTAYTFINTARFIFGFIWIASSIIISYFSFKKKGVLWLGITTFWVFLIPVTGIIPLNSMYLEHWLYGSFIGLAIILAWFLDQMDENFDKLINRIILAIVILVFILLGLRTISRNKEWANEIAFWQNELNYETDSARVYNNLGMAYIDNLDYDSAIENYKKAIEISDTYPHTRFNLGNTYADRQMFDEAFDEYIKSLQIDPNFIFTHAALYKLSVSLGEDQNAQIFSDFVNRIRNGETLTFDEIVSTRQN
ncbi:tetratricopeptide repeat protein [Candidatus Dojkabacteria bacterium]|uniref:Tetratricopeptide repeat protein n=1 Tax=Candidatus Dojkabacteria bacterium TaxID=2099670 RepID=A0A955LBD4_9BACT|nr:tetratricopeptide repeat protein [Candidatus Dojkabacteria bacterium]